MSEHVFETPQKKMSMDFEADTKTTMASPDKSANEALPEKAAVANE